MTDAVGWDADGAEPTLPSERDARFEWIDLDVLADVWWEVVDHPELAERGQDGWTYHSCTRSPRGDHRVVLTYFRARKRPVRHPVRPARRGRRDERGACDRRV
ncbi:hypothetical protein ACWDTP_17855 [Mycobacterium sp. NPDC003449]